MEYTMNILQYFPLFAQGITVTLAAWIIAASISLCMGILLGFASCAHVNNTIAQRCIKLYTFITKGIPAYVQILIAYFVIPSLLHINVSGFTAATSALALCSSGYATEIIRAGINSVPQGQWQACFVLGYPFIATIRRIIIPQVLRIILPGLIGEAEQLLKSTTLLATIGVTEVTRVGMNIISRELNPLPIYCIIALTYLAFSALLHVTVTYAQPKDYHDYY